LLIQLNAPDRIANDNTEAWLRELVAQMATENGLVPAISAIETLPLAPVAGGRGMEANLAVNRIGDVKGVLFAQLKAGATEDWHIAPRRQFMVCVRGIVEITASDGQKRRLTPGQFMLLEDTTGKGHITHAAGAEDHVALAVPVPDGVLTRR
jgi:hypothetical protein